MRTAILHTGKSAPIDINNKLIYYYANLFNNPTNKEEFFKEIRKERERERFVQKMPKVSQLELSKGQIIIRNPNIRLQSRAEIMLSRAALKVGINVMFEPVRVNLTRDGLCYTPDIWTNIYRKIGGIKQISVIEIHPFLKLREMLRNKIERNLAMGRITLNEANNQIEQCTSKEIVTVNKWAAMRMDHPEIYFIVRTDMSRERFMSEFGVRDISLVCDEYYVDTKGFNGVHDRYRFREKMGELMHEMSNLKKMPGAVLEENVGKWHQDVSNIIRMELLKALR